QGRARDDLSRHRREQDGGPARARGMGLAHRAHRGVLSQRRGGERAVTWLLASVRTPAEACCAIDGGADIIDLKEPAQGALGRLSDRTIAAIRHDVAGRRPISATIGDLPLAPAPVLEAVRAMAANGVDIVKLGVFAGDAAATVTALGGAARDGIRLAAVLFADRAPDFSLVARCADAGFYGVMLDTADKATGSLTRHLGAAELAHFIADARRPCRLAVRRRRAAPAAAAARLSRFPLGAHPRHPGRAARSRRAGAAARIARPLVAQEQSHRYCRRRVGGTGGNRAV